jgi:acyl-CoA synthetase (AMP-forming)/AMP-acid ligase II
MVPKYNLPGAVKFTTALKKGNSANLKMHKTGLDEVILLQYTGGTTGISKGAMLTNSNMLYNMFQVKAWIADADLKEGVERVLTPLPLYHIFSFTVNCLCLGSFGAENILVINPRDIPALVKIIALPLPRYRPVVLLTLVVFPTVTLALPMLYRPVVLYTEILAFEFNPYKPGIALSLFYYRYQSF